MDIIGFKGGQPRHPLQGLADEAKERVRQMIINEGFISA